MPQGNPFGYFNPPAGATSGPQSATAATPTPGEEQGFNQQQIQAQAQQLFAGAPERLARLADPNLRAQLAQQLAQQFPAPPPQMAGPGVASPGASPGAPAAASTFAGPGPTVPGQGAPDPMAYLQARFPMTPPQVPGGFGNG